MKLFYKFFLLTAVCMLPLISCKKDDPQVTQKPEPEVPSEPTTPTEPFSTDVPDKEGKNIKGVVYCNNSPVADVVVSDGDEVTTTDANGRYYLNSTKKNKNVFISIPSGYSMKEGGKWQQFYQALGNDQSVEQHNFELVENPNKDYVVIGLADIHIANVRECVSQYSNKFLPDLNKTINDYKIAGKEVYVMCLGDQSHDLYWYDKGGIDLEGSKPYLTKIDGNYMFTTMGNHDNDPYIADDFLATSRYRTTYGPTHFSYNVNGTHYVMLDNIVYTNVGATGSKMGDREYEATITADQLNWLRKDLAYVKKSSPIVIGMHAPLWKKPSLSGTAQTYTPKYSVTNGADLVSVLNGYNVTVLSGHAHMNASSKVGTVEEYNVGSGAGRLWYSGQTKYGSQHLCGDGSPAGFLVMEVYGTSKRVFYKGTDCDPEYQFRTYDMNKCHITAAEYCPSSTDAKINELGECMNDYKNARSDNKVRINVFGYKESWKIRVTEGGKELPLTRLYNYDPLWIISVPCRQYQKGEKSSIQTPTKNAHIFECTASSATSTLEIQVTDDFGKVYRETMTRPKALTTTMR